MHLFFRCKLTARCIFRVRELLMSFSFVPSTSFFSLRTLSCSELTTASSGVSWACETIFSTSDAVVFIDAWYCRSASWLGFIISSPPSLTGSARGPFRSGLCNDGPLLTVLRHQQWRLLKVLLDLIIVIIDY